ncbi:MAG: RelA/SpoT family protein [Nitrospinales bacterium]
MLKLDDITNAVLSYHPEADLDIILEAYVFSAKAHRGQSRQSGAAYLSHPLAVAFNLTKLKLDEITVAVGLLHDTVEDTTATPEEIKELFGEEVFQLVDGVTKISKMEFSGRMEVATREEKQSENFRKMILAMARDIRVVLIKLADRAHNMKTLDSMSREAQQRIAKETLEIYAPLANRLGIGWLKAELENDAFRYIYPEEDRMIRQKIAQAKGAREKYVQGICDLVSKELKAANIHGTVVGRPKHFYSIYKKMQDQGIDFNDVYDLVGVRVLTDTVKNCYAILGLIHSLWKPIPGKFKDYVAMPKPNMYRSLHTTVMGPDGQRVEVQIRTEEMHKVCEEGIAAHWQYKEGGGGQPKKMEQQLVWVRRLLEGHEELKNPKEFLDAFKVNLYPHEVYVFTPMGEVVALPDGASPVDFAYFVHTDIGHHCLGAKVNGKIVPLRYKLRNGDRVEILTSKQKTPSRDWLALVKTSRARSKILSFLNSREKARNLELGKTLLEKEISRCDLNPASLLKGKPLEAAIQACGFNSFDSLLAAIGFGKISARHFAEKLIPKEKLASQKAGDAPHLKPAVRTASQQRRDIGIKVKNFNNDDLLLRMGKCCSPVPGDKILGYITRGRGISVHTVDCLSIGKLAGESERLIEVEWDSARKTCYPMRISIVSEDKPGLLAEISGVLANSDINITRAAITQGAYKRAYFDFSIEVCDLEHLNRTLQEVAKTQGVIHVERVKKFRKKVSPKMNPKKLSADLNPAGGGKLAAG